MMTTSADGNRHSPGDVVAVVVRVEVGVKVAVDEGVVVVGDVCAVLGEKTASFAVDIDLWRSSQKRYQRACERGSADAKWAGKERRAAQQH